MVLGGMEAREKLEGGGFLPLCVSSKLENEVCRAVGLKTGPS